VGGPACEFKISQGLLKERAAAAPWILDPTAAGARVRRGPRRAPGARVHGGPPFQNEGVCDQIRPCKIRRPWTCACGMRRRRRRSAAARGGNSPARLQIVLWVTFSCASGLYTKLSNMRTPPGVQGDGAGTHGGRRRKGADRPLRRAHGAAKACKKKENRARKFCSPREETLGELTGEGEAAVKEFDGDGGSGGAPAGGDPSSRRCTTPVAASPGQQASREGYDRVRGRKG
jgi:hypothetical protein